MGGSVQRSQSYLRDILIEILIPLFLAVWARYTVRRPSIEGRARKDRWAKAISSLGKRLYEIERILMNLLLFLVHSHRIRIWKKNGMFHQKRKWKGSICSEWYWQHCWTTDEGISHSGSHRIIGIFGWKRDFVFGNIVYFSRKTIGTKSSGCHIDLGRLCCPFIYSKISPDFLFWDSAEATRPSRSFKNGQYLDFFRAFYMRIFFVFYLVYLTSPQLR